MPDHTEPSNEALMAAFQRDRRAETFDRLVERFTPSALGVARQILSDAALAEDAVQEAFLRVVRRGDRYNPARTFSTWFYTIVRNVCTDMLRRRMRQNRLVREIAERTSEPKPPAPTGDAAETLEQLPVPERDVLMLRIIDGLSFAEVAAAMGISAEAAKKRAQRGLKRLRRTWSKDSCPPAGPSGVSDTEAT